MVLLSIYNDYIVDVYEQGLNNSLLSGHWLSYSYLIRWYKIPEVNTTSLRNKNQH
jgi:hypothetical protein